MNTCGRALLGLVAVTALAAGSMAPAHAGPTPPPLWVCVPSYSQADPGPGVGVRYDFGVSADVTGLQARWRAAGDVTWSDAVDFPRSGVDQVPVVLAGMTAGQVVEVDYRCQTPAGVTEWASSESRAIETIGMKQATAPQVLVIEEPGGVVLKVSPPQDMGGTPVVYYYRAIWFRDGTFIDSADASPSYWTYEEILEQEGPSAIGNQDATLYISGLTPGVSYDFKVDAHLQATPIVDPNYPDPGGWLSPYKIPGNARQISRAPLTIIAKGYAPKDSDGDGVTDQYDGCPTAIGPISNGGCPVPPPPPPPPAPAVVTPAPVVSAPAPATGPSTVVRVKATGGKSKLFVDVNPNKGSGYWMFQVQRQLPDGTWKPLKTYKTKGSKETRTINLPKGTYQVVVGAKDGYIQTTSAPIYLKR